MLKFFRITLILVLMFYLPCPEVFAQIEETDTSTRENEISETTEIKIDYPITASRLIDMQYKSDKCMADTRNDIYLIYKGLDNELERVYSLIIKYYKAMPENGEYPVKSMINSLEKSLMLWKQFLRMYGSFVSCTVYGNNRGEVCNRERIQIILNQISFMKRNFRALFENECPVDMLIGKWIKINNEKLVLEFYKEGKAYKYKITENGTIKESGLFSTEKLSLNFLDNKGKKKRQECFFIEDIFIDFMDTDNYVLEFWSGQCSGEYEGKDYIKEMYVRELIKTCENK